MRAANRAGSSEPDGGRWWPSAWAAVIIAATVVVYFPALTGGYLWDDALYITDNPALRSFAGLRDIWRLPTTTRQYYPFTFTSFWVEYHLWGDAPLGYHCVNVVLHATNAWLVWRLLGALQVPGAFLAAWIFAVHPVHVESVAWIAERKNVLSGLFALLTAISWIGFLADAQLRRFVLTVAFFAGALLSKTQVCTLPLILALLVWWKQPDSWRGFLPYVLLLATMGAAAATITLLSEWSGPEVVPLPTLQWSQRLVVAGYAVWFYIVKVVWPADLMAIYGHWRVDARDYHAYLFPVAAAALPVVMWSLRRRLGMGPCVAILASVASLLPVLGLVDFNFMRYAFVADHFQYLASIPIIALGAAAGARVTARARYPAAGGLAHGAAAVLLVVLATLSWRRATVHRDEEALWRDNIARNAQSTAAYNNLGAVLLAQQRFDEAITSFAAALRIDAGDARARINWGDALAQQSKWTDATAQYREALRIRPESSVAHNSLGVALHAQGDIDGALRAFAESIRLHPRNATAHANWAATLVAVGRPEEALEHFAAAVRLNPNSYQSRAQWGEALQQLQRYDSALEQHRAAVRLDPSRADGRVGLGVALLNLNRADEAVSELESAIALDPRLAAGHHYLGVALSVAGRADVALQRLATAAQLDPNSAEIQNHWGVALAMAGHRDEARARFQAALRLRPSYIEAHDNLARLTAASNATARER